MQSYKKSDRLCYKAPHLFSANDFCCRFACRRDVCQSPLAAQGVMQLLPFAFEVKPQETDCKENSGKSVSKIAQFCYSVNEYRRHKTESLTKTHRFAFRLLTYAFRIVNHRFSCRKPALSASKSAGIFCGKRRSLRVQDTHSAQNSSIFIGHKYAMTVKLPIFINFYRYYCSLDNKICNFVSLFISNCK